MAESGQGFEMASYLSPLLFLTLHVFLILGSCIGLSGVLVKGKARERLLSGLFCLVNAVGLLIIAKS